MLISDLGLPDGTGWGLLDRLQLPRPIYAVAMSGFEVSYLLDHPAAMPSKTHSTTSAVPSQPAAATIESVRREPESISADTLCAERQRIAQTLHDTICQELTGFYLMASGASLKYRATSPAAAQKLDDLAGKIQRAGAKLGVFVSQLRVDGPL